MDSTGNSFTGRYTYTLDAKGRVNIPAKMRKSLDPASDSTFVATRGRDECIALYPATVWKNEIEAKLRKLNKGLPSVRQFIRNTVSHAEALQYDGQGRVALPAGLIDFAAIGKSTVIVGMIDRIEIWNPDTLKEHESAMDNGDADLEDLINEIDI